MVEQVAAVYRIVYSAKRQLVAQPGAFPVLIFRPQRLGGEVIDSKAISTLGLYLAVLAREPTGSKLSKDSRTTPPRVAGVMPKQHLKRSSVMAALKA